jgi:LmbE family N-acetylglucosaminyl deacetylase
MFFYLLMNDKTKTVAVIVAHPDDETLWTGGTLLNNPRRQYFIISLCRKNDPDRAPKFKKVLEKLGATGCMGDLDDGPEQMPLTGHEVQNAILDLLPSRHFDLVITHSIHGEYTRHRRHEEVGRAVINLWHSQKINTAELWAFAYEDGHRAYNPIAIEEADLFFALDHHIWEEKYSIITNTYGFNKTSWEAQTTPKEEAFRQFYNAADAYNWLISAHTEK